jgi:hypothetical protein
VIDVGRDLERMRDYVAGRLADDEHRAFEDRLAKDPELVRELELSQRLREGLERLRTSGHLDSVVRREAPRRLAWGVGLAAALAGVALLLWLLPTAHSPSVLMSPMMAGTASSGQREPISAKFTFFATRGLPATSVFDLPPGGLIELSASRSTASPDARYRMTLYQLGAGGARVPIGEVVGLESGPDGLVRSYADSGRLTPGGYELRVQAEGDAVAGAEVFAFSLRAGGR